MTRRIVIYTRYSTDMQSPKSCQDQEREVREALTRMGIDHRLAIVIHDEAESGTKTFRSEFERLDEMNRAHEILILAVDDQARLTRADNAYAFITDVVYNGGRFISTGEGIDTTQQGWQLRVKVMELHNSTTIQELGRRVRRGQIGRLLAGLTAGDYPFGYESFLVNPEKATLDRRGPKPEKDVRIYESEARWVRQIFGWFLEFRSLTNIAEELTRQGVDRGHQCRKNTAWNHRQVRAILANAKYTGQWEWGKTTTIRNSAGRSKQIPVPPEQWLRTERADLRIIEQSEWERAQARLAELDRIYGQKPGQKKRGPRVHHTAAYPAGLLHGLIYCQCGARMHYRRSNNKLYLGCPKKGNAPGMCKMRTLVSIEKAKSALVSTVATMLTGSPDWLPTAVAAIRRHITETATRVPLEAEADRRRLSEIGIQIENLIDNMTRSKHNSTAVQDHLANLEEQAATLRLKVEENAKLLSTPPQLPTQAWVMNELANLNSILEEESRAAALLLQKLFGQVKAYAILPPGKERGYVQLRFRFDGWAALREILPSEVIKAVLAQAVSQDELAAGDANEFCIDLGAPTRMDEWAPQIAKWRAEGVLWKDICEWTGLGSGPAYETWKRFVDAQKPTTEVLPPNATSDEPDSNEPVDQDDAA